VLRGGRFTSCQDDRQADLFLHEGIAQCRLC
jgi:hypothetical protein